MAWWTCVTSITLTSSHALMSALHHRCLVALANLTVNHKHGHASSATACQKVERHRMQGTMQGLRLAYVHRYTYASSIHEHALY